MNRADFPILARQVHGHPLVYFDNAATTQKPEAVLTAMDNYYRQYNANVHRGIHRLSEEATHAYEQTRKSVRDFINAPSEKECLFVRSTTDAINLVAQSFARPRLQAGDEIVISHLEHHANIVPWQIVCEQAGAKLKIIPINDAGELCFDEYRALLNDRTRLIAIGHVSNALGTINPIEKIVEAAHARDIPVLVDGAQAAPHMNIDVQALDCDFYAFSSHKIYGPTSIGVLYGKEKWLEAMPPYQGGGDMIASVSFTEGTTYNVLPAKFEAGTPAIAEAIGLGAAIAYLQNIGLDKIQQREQALLNYATNETAKLPGFTPIGTAKEKASILSFALAGVHPHDIATILDQYGIAIRSGHHCAMPLMERLGLPATARASFSFYNTEAEIDTFIMALAKTQEFLAR